MASMEVLTSDKKSMKMREKEVSQHINAVVMKSCIERGNQIFCEVLQLINVHVVQKH